MTGTLDPDAYRSRFAARSAKARGRSADRYLEHFDDILEIQDYLLAEAERHGLPIVDNVHFDTAVVSVIRSVIATLPTGAAAGLEGGKRCLDSAMRLSLCALARRARGLRHALASQEEKQMGAQAQAQLRKQLTFVRDPVTVNYVRKFGESLAKAARPSPFEFRFYVVEDETLNAFAIPGGAMYVNTGPAARGEELAPSSPACSRTRWATSPRATSRRWRTAAATPASSRNIFYIAGRRSSPAIPISRTPAGSRSSVAGQAYMNTYTRDAEREADALAVETMVHAGWNPEGMVTMFETLKKEYGRIRRPAVPRPAIPRPTSASRTCSATSRNIPAPTKLRAATTASFRSSRSA